MKSDGDIVSGVVMCCVVVLEGAVTVGIVLAAAVIEVSDNSVLSTNTGLAKFVSVPTGVDGAVKVS